MTETEGTMKVTEGHDPPSKPPNPVTQWEQIDWGKAEKNVIQLRRRKILRDPAKGLEESPRLDQTDAEKLF
jgi:hypothetical protein